MIRDKQKGKIVNEGEVNGTYDLEYTAAELKRASERTRSE